MADTLETLEHLAVWTGKDPAVVAADPFAQMVLERATEMVIEKAGIPSTWTADPSLVPSRAKTICLLLAARTYTNRRSVISSGVGPISETILAAMAAAMQLTEAEADELQGMANENAGTYGGLWTISTTRGEDYPIAETVVLQDSTGSDWGIPYAVEGETGAFDTLVEDPGGDGTTGGGIDPGAFTLLQAQVSTLMGVVSDLDANKADASTVSGLEDSLASKAEQSDLVAGLSVKANASDLAAKADQAAVDAALALKASVTELAAKADQSTVNAALSLKANVDDMVSQLAAKADASALAAKADQAAVDAALADKADAADLATKADASALAAKADQATVDAALADKADQAAVDAALADKADVDDLLAKADQAAVDAALALKADSADLGPQIHLGDTPPTSGSGELWADTTED